MKTYLKDLASDDLANHLIRHREEIVQRCQALLRREFPINAGKPPDYHDYLATLALAVDSSQPPCWPSMGGTLSQRLTNLRLLQVAVFDHLEDSGATSRERRTLILAVLQRAMHDTAVDYAEVEAACDLARREGESRIAAICAVIESIPAAVLIGDIHGVTRCNSEALQMFGVASMEELNRDAARVIERVRIRSFETGLPLATEELASSRAVRGQYVQREEIRFSPALDRDIVVQVSGAPLHQNGQLIGGVVIITDITSRKQAEKELQESERRFRQVTDEQKRALERLREERELREKFVFALTHDLRTPLTAVKASAQLMRRYPERVEIRDGLMARIISDVERADQMIRDLLDANRIRAGQKLPLLIGLCDLAYIARDTLRDLSLIYDDRFTLRSPEQITGYWSAEGLRRVIENLASNAIKYGNPLQPIGVEVLAHPKHVALLVHNHGNPLSVDEQQGIFRVFHRTQSAQKSRKKGWGIGLTLVRGIVEAHGGTIRIESTAERGTTFTVELPRDAREVVGAGK